DGRAALAEEFASRHGDLLALPKILRNCDDADTRSGLCTALGFSDPSEFSTESRLALTQVLVELFKSAPDGGTHAAADWALRQWKAALPVIEPAREPASGRHWYVNSVGMTMVEMEPGVLLLQRNTVIYLTRRYFAETCEVSIKQFRLFLDDANYPADKKSGWR